MATVEMDEACALNLVAILDAIVQNDPTAYRKATTETTHHRTSPWYNYFCFDESDQSHVALVLYDSAKVRLLVWGKLLDRFVHFGVHQVPAAKIVQLIHKRDKPVIWNNIDEFEVSAIYEIVEEEIGRVRDGLGA